MDKQPEQIGEILKHAPGFTVSKKKDAQILNELSRLQINQQIPSKGNYFIYLTNTIMANYTKFAAWTVVIALVVGIGIVGVLQSQTTYASHLENAEKAMQELQVMRNEGLDANEARAMELVQQIAQETKSAMDIAEGKLQGAELTKAYQEIQQVQTRSMNMFMSFERELKSKEAADAVSGAIMEQEQQRERVREMLGDQSGEMVQEQSQLQNQVQDQNQDQNHLENAEKAMTQLQTMQGDGAETEPVRVKALVQEIVQETNSAMVMAQAEPEENEMQKALQEVQQVQEKSLNMFMEMERKMEDEEAGESLKQAIQETEQQRERVREMLGDQSGEMVQEQSQLQNQVADPVQGDPQTDSQGRR